MPKKSQRCVKGKRRCFFSRKCVVKNGTKRAKRCTRGERQCADRKCYRKGYNTRSRRNL